MGDLIVNGYKLKTDRMVVGGTPDPGWAAFDGTKVGNPVNVAPDTSSTQPPGYIDAIQYDATRFLVAYNRGNFRVRVRVIEIGGSPEITFGPFTQLPTTYTGNAPKLWSRISNNLFLLSSTETAISGPNLAVIEFDGTGNTAKVVSVNEEVEPYDPAASEGNGVYSNAYGHMISDTYGALFFNRENFGSPQFPNTIPHVAMFEVSGSPLSISLLPGEDSPLFPSSGTYDFLNFTKRPIVLNDNQFVWVGSDDISLGGVFAANVGITSTGQIDFVNFETLVTPAVTGTAKRAETPLGDIFRTRSGAPTLYDVGVVTNSEEFKTIVTYEEGEGSPAVAPVSTTEPTLTGRFADLKAVQHPNQLVSFNIPGTFSSSTANILVWDYAPATNDITLSADVSFQPPNTDFEFAPNTTNNNLLLSRGAFIEYERNKGIIFSLFTEAPSSELFVGAMLIEV